MGHCTRIAQFLSLLTLVLAASGSAFGFQPTTCANSAVMKNEIKRFGDSYLTDANDSNDNLYDHVDTFIKNGSGNNIDPRLAAAIAGVESNYGNVDTTCIWHDDNPWSLFIPGTQICISYNDVPSSIAGVSADLDVKVNQSDCNTLAAYAPDGRCKWCVIGPGPTPTPNAKHDNQSCMYWNQPTRHMDTWLYVFTGRFGRYTNGNLGGNPNTTSLTYPWDGQCNKGDCNGDGQTTVDEILTAVNIALGNADVSICPAVATSVPCASAAALSGQAAAGETGFCGIVTISDILQDVNVALNGPGDPLPLPTIPPDQMWPNPETCDQSGNCHEPCEGCDTTDCTASCEANGHCGDSGCTFCEDYCVPATPTPPPTPTPSPTAACTIALRGPQNGWPKGYDCQMMRAYVWVVPPYVPTSVRITQDPLPGSIPMALRTPTPGLLTPFIRYPYIVGEGPFKLTITAYGDEGPICFKEFGYDGDPATTPEAWGVQYPDANGDSNTVLCGLGGGDTPGLVWPGPPATATLTPTPTPAPHCVFDAQPRSGYDCTSVLITGRADPPFDTQVDHVTVTQTRPSLRSFDFTGGSRWAYLAGGYYSDLREFTLNLTAYYANGTPMCSGSVSHLYANGFDPNTWCGKLDADPNPGLALERPETPAPQYACSVSLSQGYTGAPFDAYMNISPSYADQQVTSVTITEPNGPFVGGPITLARTAPGQWVAHLCYDGDACIGPYTITFNVFQGSTLLGTCHQTIQFAGCNSWGACDQRCSAQCACQACAGDASVENQQVN